MAISDQTHLLAQSRARTPTKSGKRTSQVIRAAESLAMNVYDAQQCGDGRVMRYVHAVITGTRAQSCFLQSECSHSCKISVDPLSSTYSNMYVQSTHQREPCTGPHTTWNFSHDHNTQPNARCDLLTYVSTSCQSIATASSAHIALHALTVDPRERVRRTSDDHTD